MISQAETGIEAFDQVPPEVTYESLWNSCVGMAAQLPLRADQLTLINGFMERSDGESIPAIRSRVSLRWAGGLATGFLQFGAVLYSRPRVHPTNIKPLELDVLLAMGKPQVTPRPMGCEVVDLAPLEARHPVAATQIARACLPHIEYMTLEWLPENYETRSDNVDPIPRRQVERQFDSPTYEYEWAQSAIYDMVSLADIRRRLAPVIGRDSGIYQAEYEAIVGVHDRLFPESTYDEPYPSRVSDMKVADLRSSGWYGETLLTRMRRDLDRCA